MWLPETDAFNSPGDMMFIRGCRAADENIFSHWLFVNCSAYLIAMLADCELFKIIYHNNYVYHRTNDKKNRSLNVVKFFSALVSLVVYNMSLTFNMQISPCLNPQRALFSLSQC